MFLGAAGLPGELDADRSMPIEETLCTRVVESGQPLVVTDARLVPDLADHPAVAAHGLVGYAGFPVRGADGRAIAALCAIEYGPRDWDARTLEVMADLAEACSTEVQLREQQEHTQAAREAAERSDAVTSALFTPGCHRTDRWVELAAGDTQVLFTDGLIERRGESLAVGIERLVVAVRDGSRTPEQLLVVLAPQRDRRDDVVVLTATVLPRS